MNALATHPATTHQRLSVAKRAEHGIGDRLFRLLVSVEGPAAIPRLANHR